MVGLVPVEKDVIPMVLLVNMREGDLDYFHLWPGWVHGNSDGPFLPMVRLVPIGNNVISVVLLVNMHLIINQSFILTRYVWLGTGQFRLSIGTNGTIVTDRKGCHSNGSIGE